MRGNSQNYQVAIKTNKLKIRKLKTEILGCESWDSILIVGWVVSDIILAGLLVAGYN